MKFEGWYEFHWPDSGEVLVAGSVYYIGWLLHPCFYKNARKEAQNFMYAYTTDAGDKWTIIEDNIDLESHMIYSCEWTVPDVETTKCYILFTNDSTFKDYWVISPRYTITRKTSVSQKVPIEFTVFQNSPNPFNPSTTITFAIPEAGNVTAEIFNTAGHKVATPVSGFLEAGKHTVVWDAGAYPAGVYCCRVNSGRYSDTLKMTMVK